MKHIIPSFAENTSRIAYDKEEKVYKKLLFTPKEAAQILSLAPRTVYALVDAGTLPCVRIGRSVRISRKAILTLAGEA